MKFFITAFCIIVLFCAAGSISSLAQTKTRGGAATNSSLSKNTAEILATADGQKFTADDLPADLRDAYRQRNAKTAELRNSFLTEVIVNELFEAEAAARGLTVEKLTEEARAKASAAATPTEAQIKAVYTANRAKIGDRALDETLREQIVAFLRGEAQQKAIFDLVSRLKIKYKVAVLKDVNAPNLKAADVLFTVGAKKFTVGQFEQKAKLGIYEYRAGIYDAVSDTLEEMIYEKLVETEAKKSGIASGDLLAREITDKLRDYSDEESERLRDALQQKLFQKYNAKILIKAPETLVQNISIDDDPSRGNVNAPVTVVMFSDFQCPACAATHPVLQKVLAEYGAEKIRFVVRDFPLKMHKDAFLAAQAAGAANAQGKFFEYAEILYQNQSALDAASLSKYAADLGLNVQQFELDLQSGKFAGEVRKDMTDGEAYGINGTPTIFVNGVRLRQLSAKAFRRAIDRALDQRKTAIVK